MTVFWLINTSHPDETKNDRYMEFGTQSPHVHIHIYIVTPWATKLEKLSLHVDSAYLFYCRIPLFSLNHLGETIENNHFLLAIT